MSQLLLTKHDLAAILTAYFRGSDGLSPDDKVRHAEILLELYRLEIESGPSKDADTQLVPAIDDVGEIAPVSSVKTGFDLGAAMEAADDSGLTTSRFNMATNSYATILNDEDTEKILRGEPASSFEHGFVKARLDLFIGRSIEDWAESNEGLLVVTHR